MDSENIRFLIQQGEGIRNTFKYLPHYVPGVKPVFVENDMFKTEIPFWKISLGLFAESFRDWLDFPESATEHLLSGLNNINLPAELIEQSWEDTLLHLVPGWHLNGTRLSQIKWPEKQAFASAKKKKVPSKDSKGTQLAIKTNTDYLTVTQEMIKKVPGWNKKGTKLLAKRSVYLISILCLASEPIKREEIMDIIGYANKKTFTDLYLMPLLQGQLIKRTHEENPSATNQQYYLTEKGKHFLGGTLS